MGALDGIRIIDLSRVLCGPYCTQILADHGADVIKVEPPQGDDVRDWGPPFQDGQSAYFSGINRNKRSVGLDLRKPEGREVLLTLLEGADVLIENFKPGSMEKWGLGYDDVLAERFPGLVHARITGFGSDGPLGGLPGYDAAVQALCGLLSVNGSPAAGPVRIGVSLVDMGAGLYAAIGILAALHERSRSGRGQSLEATLFDVGYSLLHPHTPNYYMSGETPELTGNAHPNIYPYDLFKTQGSDLFLAVGNNGQFAQLMAVLGQPDVATYPQFMNNADRSVNRDALKSMLTELLAEQDGDDLADRLLAAGVPCGAALTVPKAAAHPHTRHRDMVVEFDGYTGSGIPLKFSRTPGDIHRKPPAFGEHGREVLREAGLTDDEIERLLTGGIVLEARKR